MHHYRAEIDGLRALAIIPVVLFHCGVAGFSGGYLGVDLFFVLSGYLITQIIVTEINANRFSILRFWARRVRRIFPVFIAVVMTSLILAQSMTYPEERRYVANQSVVALGFVANWHFLWNTGDYFSPTAEQSALLHTWSLSVEEQFYLIYPWLLIVTLRFMPRYVLWVFVSLMIMSFWSFLQSRSSGDGSGTAIAFYGSHNRAWELLAGSVVAAIQHRKLSKGIDPLLPRLGLTLIGFALFFQFQESRSEYNALGIVLGTMALLSGSGSGWIIKALSHPVVTMIGKLSYSIYMWHWPWIFWGMGRLEGRSPLWLLPGIVLTAVASYFLIEQPMRRWRGGVPWIAAAYALVMIVALSNSRPPQSVVAADQPIHRPRWNGAMFDLSPREQAGDWMRRLNQAGVILGQQPANTPSIDVSAYFRESGLMVGCSEERTPKWVVLGDSHAAMWSHGLKRLAQDWDVPVSFWSIHGVDPFVRFPLETSNGSGVLSGEEKLAYDTARLQKISSWKPQVVIVAARWLLWETNAPEELIDFLHRHAEHVLIVGVVAESDIGDGLVVSYLDSIGYVPHQDSLTFLKMKDPEKLREAEQRLEAFADRYENVTIVPMLDLFARGRDCLVAIGDQTIYLDDDHLTQYGADLGLERIQSHLRVMTLESE